MAQLKTISAIWKFFCVSKRKKMSHLTSKIKDSITTLDAVVSGLREFCLTATEENYLTTPVIKSRNKLNNLLVKVTFLEEARAKKINTGKFSRPKIQV